MIYTIGNCKNYDKRLKEDNLYKSKGGTVWKKFSDVLNYFNNSKVYIDDKEVEGAIYIVDGIWNTDVDVLDQEKGTLNKPCKIIKKI